MVPITPIAMSVAVAPTLSADSSVRTATLLECTLRDGSYAIDYAFTAAESAAVALALESAGVRWIEIGHGLGIGASERGHGKSAATDLEYCEAVDAALTEALWGVFFIPGIGTHEELAQAIDAGLDFVRIGTNVTEVARQAPFIKQARDAGIRAYSNLMKSYAVPPEEFAHYAAACRDLGAEGVSVVDSAGGMVPSEVAAYVHAARARCGDLPIGFHGHNNLGLANANALAALEAGASIVDTTLNGLGRSAGNAITESLVLILERCGFVTGIDPILIQDIGRRYIQPYLQHKGGLDPIDLTLGAARFHSSYLGEITAIAQEFGLDRRALVFAVGAVDAEHPTTQLMRDIATRLAREAAQVRDYPVRVDL
ncbi:MAG: 4-hydroxy-2-oxovalerate aldolase [bacterium]